jgi:hypothetical protein
MDSDFQMNGIDWTGKGYFGVPPPPPSAKLPADLTRDPWLLWTVACHRARQGDFALLPSLVPLCKRAEDPVLAQSASYLLGDAGTAACFPLMAQEMESAGFVGTVLEYCRAIHFRGKLADVPRILRAYERIAGDSDADIVPVWLSNLLEPEDGVLSESIQFEELEDYLDAVRARYEQVTEELGTDQVFVYRGAIFGVQRMARYILQRVRRPFVRGELRHRFEAATGIDCRAFYKGGDVQPLAAAALIEEFLESPDAAKYQDGVRYFFGHRIPD